ncbi:MAG: hypothetical protein HY319_06710 [Armatimonadetes bacterium]|nr:hypothetical protein [Armatimonadota bacterium]
MRIASIVRAAAVASIVLGLWLSGSSAEYRFWETASRGELRVEVEFLDRRSVERPLEISYPAKLWKAWMTPRQGEEVRFYTLRLGLPFLGLSAWILSLPERRKK